MNQVQFLLGLFTHYKQYYLPYNGIPIKNSVNKRNCTLMSACMDITNMHAYVFYFSKKAHFPFCSAGAHVNLRFNWGCCSGARRRRLWDATWHRRKLEIRDLSHFYFALTSLIHRAPTDNRICFHTTLNSRFTVAIPLSHNRNLVFIYLSQVFIGMGMAIMFVSPYMHALRDVVYVSLKCFIFFSLAHHT